MLHTVNVNVAYCCYSTLPIDHWEQKLQSMAVSRTVLNLLDADLSLQCH